MKFLVKVENRQFEVTIDDIHARPVIAIVEGDAFEIWPQDASAAKPVPGEPAERVEPVLNPEERSGVRESHKPAKNGTGTNTNGSDTNVFAPIPGTVISILVKPGEQVSTGQELLVLEAMKMKNSIRAPHSGRVKSILVVPGQTVKHHDILVEFAE